MNDKDPTPARIDDFLLDRFDEAELKAFEAELTGDPDLAAEVNRTREAMDAVVLAEDQTLKARLQKLEAGLRDRGDADGASAPPGPSAKVVAIGNRGRTYRLLAYAAALLLALFAGWYALNPPANDDPRQLAMAYFEPFDNYATGTLRNSAEPTPEELAYAAYDDGNYRLAAERLTALPPTDANRFYLAQSLLAGEDFAAAKPVLNELRTRTDFALAPEATYFAALAELATGQTAAARALLTDVAATEGHPFRARAAELLEDL